jgi:ATP-dependent HslUV protease ATP-binding subunit HslU
MMGPTGVGKTEIARRLAKLVDAPLVKVEATKFTEVGYVGRDVDSMVRDLVEASIRLCKDKRAQGVRPAAEAAAEQRLVDALLSRGQPPKRTSAPNPLQLLLGGTSEPTQAQVSEEERAKRLSAREETLNALRAGALEDEVVEIEVEQQATNGNAMMAMGIDVNLNEMFGGLLPNKKKRTRLKIHEARRVLIQDEIDKRIDIDAVTAEAIEKAEQDGIIFIDEIDKIVGSEHRSGADVSREGVQRDILPIVEGSTVNTKYGPVKTDYMLFIAAGAFHIAKPSDLIPELQGRFPIRVELEPLTVEDYRQILTQPQNALTKQYAALLQTDNIILEFSDDALIAIAQYAYNANLNIENIGARRLHTILENLLEDISFNAGGDYPLTKVLVDDQYVREHISKTYAGEDLARFIL